MHNLDNFESMKEQLKLIDLSKRVTQILLLVFCVQAKAQTFLETIEKKFQSNPPFGTIHYKYQADTLGDFHYPFQPGNLRHTYFWHKGKMLIQLDGTGILLARDSGNTVKRLDSTFYQGYNFGAFNFVYKDTIFSLGGYGFWNFNGMLRYYNEKNHSWYIIKTNKQIPLRLWHNARIYYDERAQKIYAVYTIPREEWSQEGGELDGKKYVQCLDLISKKWWEAPKLTNKTSFDEAGWVNFPIFNTPFGMISFIQNELKVFDFGNNRIGNIAADKSRIIQENWNLYQQLMMIARGEMLYFVNPMKAKIDSVSFSEKDISWTAEEIASDEPSSNSLLFILLAILTIGIAVVIYLFKRKADAISVTPVSSTETKPDEQKKEETFQRNIPFSETLSAVEKSLLDLILKNSSNGNMTSVNSVNEVLGIARKDVKSQNNIRAATLQMINHKFIAYSGLNDDLILKQRTAFDKRFFEYFIHSKYVQKVK